MKIGLIVEGKSDGETIKKLVEKIYAGARRKTKPGVVSRRLAQGNLLKPNKIRGVVDQMVEEHHPEIKKIIICLDCECTSEKEKQPKVSRAAKELRQLGLQPAPQYCLVVHAIEGWLASDPAALNKYFRKEIKLDWDPVKDCRPKDRLRSTFASEGKNFTNTEHNPRLAELVHIQTLIKRNPSFARFKKLLESP